MAAFISTGESLEAAEKGRNIKRYYGGHRAGPSKPRGSKEQLSLDDALPEGYASE